MQSQTRPGTLAALAAAGVVLGAIATSSNPVFVRLSDVPETASAFHRMAWALPAFALWGFATGLGTRRTGAGKGRGAPVVAQRPRSRRLVRSIGIPTEHRGRRARHRPVGCLAHGQRLVSDDRSRCPRARMWPGADRVGLAHLPAAFASVSLLVAPVSAAALAWLLLAEPLGPIQVAGMALVLVGVQLAWRLRAVGGEGDS